MLYLFFPNKLKIGPRIPFYAVFYIAPPIRIVHEGLLIQLTKMTEGTQKGYLTTSSTSVVVFNELLSLCTGMNEEFLSHL